MLLTEGKQTIGTTGVDAVPDIVLQMAEDSYAPFWLAAGTTIHFRRAATQEHGRGHHRHRDRRARADRVAVAHSRNLRERERTHG